jgi:hypothetical protein
MIVKSTPNNTLFSGKDIGSSQKTTRFPFKTHAHKMKTRMMQFATSPTHENAAAIFIGIAYDGPTVEYK